MPFNWISIAPYPSLEDGDKSSSKRWAAPGKVARRAKRILRRGERLPVEAILESQPVLQDNADAVLDLLYHEIVLRDRTGDQPRLEEYVQRFPRLTRELTAQFQVHEARVGDTALPDELMRPPSLNGHTLATSHSVDGEAPIVPGFEIQCELGRGGMGVVYLAREIKLNRLVAIKMILEGLYAGKEVRQRFQSEAESVSRIHHPNIVQIHSTGENNGRPFLVLEYVEGISLDLMKKGNPWPAGDAAKLIETLARAMHAAHQAGIVHRDLKPANVLIASDGIPRSPTSAWPNSSRGPQDKPGVTPLWVRPPTWRLNRPAARVRRQAPPPTCTRWRHPV